MKSIVCTEPYKLSYREIEKPKITEKEVLIKVNAIGICGTDIHAFTGHQPFFDYPRVLGHEVCGDITELGHSVTRFKVGERVSLIPYVACNECPSCLSGRTNCCENISVIGVHENGGFGEYLAIPESNVLPVGDIDPVTASLIEPFAISAHAVRRAAVKQGENILVVGAGPIGLGAAAIAKADGGNVVVADTSLERRTHVEKVLGVPTIDPAAKNSEESIRKNFSGHLAQTVIDATGNARAMNNAVNLICNGGKIVFVGLFKGNLEFSDPDFHKKETTMMGSRNATPEDFNKVVRLMSSGEISSEMMLTHTFNFLDIGNTFNEQVVGNKDLLKGVILL
ncbi:zinc-binding alcohol dehydrogenase family protein [Psychromonas sp. GE-S-Ul-11]|uniref:zinc-binding alcohol dehydrogenase family protein n=1 Tax=Psychromonas sp. GE-S-Ul-11 TaxID=3241170 RepID=UPI00390C4443